MPKAVFERFDLIASNSGYVMPPEDIIRARTGSGVLLTEKTNEMGIPN